MKKFMFILFTITLILGFIIGFYIYKGKSSDDKKISKVDGIDDECTQITELIKVGKLNLEEVNSSETIISPNAKIIFRKLYTKCNHTVQTVQDINEELVNLNEEELKKKYSNWKLEEFDSTKIVLYQEIDEFCNEHYLLRELDGYIAIYVLDEHDNVNYLLRMTDITTKYLTQIDLENLKQGIKIFTDVELNRVLEDYE